MPLLQVQARGGTLRVSMKKATLNGDYHMQRYLVSLLCMLSVFAYAQEQPKVIVFDLGDTLIVTDKLRAFNATGWMPFIQYAACAIGPKLLKLPEVIEHRYFTVLNKIEARRADEAPTRAPNGRLLPQVMC